MKTNKLKHLVLVITLALMTPACTQSTNEKSGNNHIDAPEMDIHTAVLYGDLNAVKQHIAAGTDLNSKEPMGGSTPLISAATFDKKEIAEVLIEAGAELSIKNKDGSTALHSAAFFCRVEIVQMLINAGADKGIKNNFGATAFESISGPFAEVKPIYEMMQQQLGSLGLQLDMKELEETRPVIAMMLQ